MAVPTMPAPTTATWPTWLLMICPAPGTMRDAGSNGGHPCVGHGKTFGVRIGRIHAHLIETCDPGLTGDRRYDGRILSDGCQTIDGAGEAAPGDRLVDERLSGLHQALGMKQGPPGRRAGPAWRAIAPPR